MPPPPIDWLNPYLDPHLENQPDFTRHESENPLYNKTNIEQTGNSFAPSAETRRERPQLGFEDDPEQSDNSSYDSVRMMEETLERQFES